MSTPEPVVVHDEQCEAKKPRTGRPLLPEGACWCGLRAAVAGLAEAGRNIVAAFASAVEEADRRRHR